MTIFVDPYHTTAGMTLDMSRVLTPLKECTIRDPLDGTNLGVRTAQGIIPVFITGCRDSEGRVPPFTHSILIKNFNGKSYLFTDLRLFVKAGASLQDLQSHIRRQDEFEFTKARAIASLAWAAGDTDRFASSMAFAGEVFAAWISQAITTTKALDFAAQKTIELLAYGFYQTLFVDGNKSFQDNEDLAMLTAKKASEIYKVPMTRVLELYRRIQGPMLSINDLITAIVQILDNVSLSPMEGRPDTGLNLRALLNMISNDWFGPNNREILMTCLEHPPTLCSIIFQCLNYNNFRRQKLGQVVQSAGRNGKGQGFSQAYSAMLRDYETNDRLVPVMEFLNPENFALDDTSGELSKLLESLHEDPAAGGSSKEMLGDAESVESLESHLGS